MGGRTGTRRDAIARRSRVVAFCRSLPEVDVEAAGTRHLAFKVRKKTLGYYLMTAPATLRRRLEAGAGPG
jgi:hypothetical protein